MTAAWMVRLDWRDRLRAMPSQTPGLIEAIGLSRADVDRAAWAVLPDGRLRSGAGAVLAAADEILMVGRPILATVGALPGVRRLIAAAYALVALNRQRLPGTPVCTVDRSVAGLEPAIRSELALRASARRAPR